jgi:hypothetical protein
MDQDQPEHVGRQPRVGADRFAEEVVDRGDRLHPRESAARHQHRQESIPLLGGALEVRLLQYFNEPVSKGYRVRQGLHPERALLQPRQPEEVGDAPQREDEMVVLQGMRVPSLCMPHDDSAPREIDVLHLSDEEHRTPYHPANRGHDVSQVQVARRDLVKHRREEDEVVVVDDRDLDRCPSRQRLLQLDGRVHPCEAAA